MDSLQCSEGQEVNLVTGTERQSHREHLCAAYSFLPGPVRGEWQLPWISCSWRMVLCFFHSSGSSSSCTQPPGPSQQLSCSAHPLPACSSEWDYSAPGAQLGTLLDLIDTLQYFEEHSCFYKNKSLKSVEVFKTPFPYGGPWDNSA